MAQTYLPPESLTPARSSRWLFIGTTVGVILIAALFIYSDGTALVRIVRNVDPWRLVWPLVCTAGSYMAMSRSYQKIAAAAGLRLGFGEMTRVTLVSTSANYILSTGGLSGLAVRSYYFFQQHRLGWGNAVSISLAQTFLTNLVLFAFLCWGVLSLSLSNELAAPSLPVVGSLFLLALVLSTLAVALVASRSVRLRLFAFLIGVINRFSRFLVRRPETLAERLAVFEEELHEGIDFLIARREKMVAPFLYICVDWLLMLATLYAAFYVLDHPVAMHVVVIGFSAGVFLSTVNLIPGGLGLMEGSMAAVFSSLGVPLETAIIATLVFRISYYVLPLLITLLLFPDMVRQARITPQRRASDPKHGRAGHG